MKRSNSRLDFAIPISQAAYRKNSSTTEHGTQANDRKINIING